VRPLTAYSACQLELECPLERPTEPNPPREVDVLVDVVRVPLDGLERNAVVGAVVELRRERSYEYEPDPQRQLPHDERRRRHGSSCAAAAAAPGAGTAAAPGTAPGAVCAGCGRHSAERAGIM
jgi:hypothetical protein